MLGSSAVRFANLDGQFPPGNPSPGGSGARAKFSSSLQALSESKSRAQCWTAERVAHKPKLPDCLTEKSSPDEKSRRCKYGCVSHTAPPALLALLTCLYHGSNPPILAALKVAV